MTIYDLFFLIFSIIYLPYLAFRSKAHKDFAQRFGVLPKVFKGIGEDRPVWIHAVSVGEVLAVRGLVEKLYTRYPDRKFILSTTTKTGNSIAGGVLPGDMPKFYFPLDFTVVLKKVLNIIKPSALVIAETEIWPNLILQLSKRKVPIALINGRLSDRSFGGYKKISFLFRNILGKITLFCMQTSLLFYIATYAFLNE